MKKLFKKLKGPKVGGGKPKELDDPPDSTPKYVVDPYGPVHDPAANYGLKPPSPPPVEVANDQGDLTGFPGYDAWLGSFTTDPQNLGFSELQGGPAANEVIRIEGFPEHEYLSVTFRNARKPNQNQEFTVTVDGPWYMTLDQLNRVMQQHGYRELLMARNPLTPEHMWLGDIAYPVNYQIPVVRSHSCYDPEVGLRINEDQPLQAFVDAVRLLKLSCNDGKLTATSWPASLEIDFNRTLRLPEGSGIHDQPSGMGVIPVHSISGVSQKLMNSKNTSLVEMAKKGGIFFPLYQREAAFLTFKAKGDVFAVRVFVGGVNAVSGLAWNNVPKNQDYLVVPPQGRLDGVVVGNGIVKQFVAMPLGSGYSVEKQVTGKEAIGGVQIEITPGNVWKLGCVGNLAPPAQPTDTAKKLCAECLELQHDYTQTAAAPLSGPTGSKPIHELPIPLRHFYLDQLDDAMKTYTAYGQQPDHIPGFVPWRAGAHVQMTAIYKYRLVLHWNEQGKSRTTEVEWSPWWYLRRCIQERVDAGFRINGQDFDCYNLYGPDGLVDGDFWPIKEQGIRDGTALLVSHKNEPPPMAPHPPPGDGEYQSYQPRPPAHYGSGMYAAQPQQQAASSGPGWHSPPSLQSSPQQHGMAARPPQVMEMGSDSSAYYGSPFSAAVEMPAVPESAQSVAETQAPSITHVPPAAAAQTAPPSRFNFMFRRSGRAEATVASSAGAVLPPDPGGGYVQRPGMYRYDVSETETASPASMHAPTISSQTTASQLRPQSVSPPSAYNGMAPMQHGSAAPSSSSYDEYGPPRSDGGVFDDYDGLPVLGRSSAMPEMDCRTAPPAALRPKGPPQQKPEPVGWAMGIAAGARIRQAVERDAFPTVAWPKQRTTLLSVQILNAVAFEALTGMLAPPTPITAQLYKEYGFPFFATWNSGDGAAADGAVNLADLRSVGDLDAGEPTKVGSSFAGGSKVACSSCRRMLCDSILRPCNHSFCSECIRMYMTFTNTVYCKLCRTRATQLLGISGPMALPGEDTVDLSNNKVITADPFGGLWAFRSIGELEGDRGPLPVPAPIRQPIRPYELE